MSNMQNNQTPEELAEECLRAIGLAFQAARYESLTGALEKLKDAQALLFRLRDMAASGAKDAARYRSFFDAGLPITFLGVDYRTKEELDAAIDATKRGGA